LWSYFYEIIFLNFISENKEGILKAKIEELEDKKY
jgi:hypothetical protein